MRHADPDTSDKVGLSAFVKTQCLCWAIGMPRGF